MKATGTATATKRAPRHGFIMDMLDLGAIDYEELASHYAPEETANED